MLIFEHSRQGRRAHAQSPATAPAASDIPAHLLRADQPLLPEVSEMQAVRHFTRLSQKNFSIDTQFYPLGSCTMKYNPRACNTLALLPGFLGRHPLAPESHGQGFLACMYDLQEILKGVTGMKGVSLTPMAGAQGELAGVLMIRAYHQARGDTARTEIICPDAAHGTNPATATMCGMTVREIPTKDDGDVDVEALKAVVGPHTAGIMLTNPSTVGVFERRIKEIAGIVHAAGGLLYYDGANLNAILGKVRPGDMGFDVIHMNLHKTFSTPHGGGGPGAGAVGVSERLLPFMPTPIVGKTADGKKKWLTE
jgi:glycine dehydrogenase subunit 2